MVTRRIAFKLYPSATQLAKLREWLRLHKELYNAAVANRRTQCKKLSIKRS
jgi:putative transposase